MSKFLKCGAKRKFYVVSYKDVDAYLNMNEKVDFEQILHIAETARKVDNKKKNEYIVINTDEKYFWAIRLIMKMFGHWG